MADRRGNEELVLSKYRVSDQDKKVLEMDFDPGCTATRIYVVLVNHALVHSVGLGDIGTQEVGTEGP